MPPELIAAVVGPTVGAIFGLTGILYRRSYNQADKQLDTIRESIELVSYQVTNLQISLPTTYATKEELLQHAAKDDNIDHQILEELKEIREDIIVLKLHDKEDRDNRNAR